MDRRSFLKGLVGVGAGLLLPPSLEENAEAARRYWPGFTPGRGARVTMHVIDEAAFSPLWVSIDPGAPDGYSMMIYRRITEWVEAQEPVDIVMPEWSFYVDHQR